MKTQIRRRDFLKTLAVFGLGGSSFINSKNLNSHKIQDTKNFINDLQDSNLKSRIFEVTLTHQIKEKGKHTRLWVPLPLQTPYQSIQSPIIWEGNFSQAFISNLLTPILYSEFKNPTPKLTITFKIKVPSYKFEENKIETEQSLQPFLKSTPHIQTDGIVLQTAKQITKNLQGDLQKAKAIYEWVATNIDRDESILGCGVGDAKAILMSKKMYGKCADMSSVFVALARSIKIPAREVFGLRLGASIFSPAIGVAKNGISNATKAQHCRAEFYIKGQGWIPVDPGDVAKTRLTENLDINSKRSKEVLEYCFGKWEMCWMALNFSRDFDLTPIPHNTPLNNFNYPYAEVDGNTLDYYDADEFHYKYESREII